MKFLLFLLFLTYNAYGQANCPATCLYNNNNFSATAVTSTIQELNSSNRGCLLTNEATTSIWFQICFSSNGVFQFEIRPSGTDNDFDFAVRRGINCPPTTQPIRCSYAVVGAQDRTGLLPTEIDNSEDASGNQYVDTIRVLAGQCYILHINNFASGSNNFNFRLNGTTATIACPSLPINQDLFTGNAEKNYNILNYKTNYYKTYLEKLINTEWITLDENNQEYKDYDLSSTISYYRLKLENIDGSLEYSQIIEIENKIIFLVKPNPVKDILTISDEKVQFEIYSLDSKFIFSGFDDQINMVDFKNGVYFIKIYNTYYKIIKF